MAKGILEGWLDGIVEKASKIISEEAVPALLRVDQVLDHVENEAKAIKARSEILVGQAEAAKLEAEAEAEKRKARIASGVIDAEFVETDEKTETKK